MNYWDSSAIVPLLVEEERTDRSAALLRGDRDIVTWWLSKVECASALNRLRRDDAFSEEQLGESLALLDTLSSGWIEVQPGARLRATALRLLRVHSLKAADAMQLAAAVAIAETDRSMLPFVTYDDRLSRAAQREGFRLAAVQSAPPHTAGRSAPTP
ncbi:MAG: type II toxin-antitoxin system VapC family toxin [Spirochaetaceae bacterium]